MNAKELGNRPAFPTEQVTSGFGDTTLTGGLTHRQWLVGMAMSGMLSNSSWPTFSGKAIADAAYKQADAILAREAQEAGDD